MGSMKAAKIAVLAFLVVGSAGAAATSVSAPGFKAPRELDTSAKGTSSVALGDLNGDGKLDVVATHGAFDEDPPALKRLRLVSVLYGRGKGRFGPPHNYEIGQPGDLQGAFSIALGDVNGDGKADVVTGNRASKSVSLLMNDGHGALERPINYSLARQPWDVALADLNGDGSRDIATGNPNTVSILLNDGEGTFGAVHEYPAGRSTWAFAVADLSGDGRPDIATANRRRNSTSVLVNQGDGSFGAPVDYRTAPGPATVAVGDVNGDGKADLISGNGSTDDGGRQVESVSILLGRGDGTLRPRRDYRLGKDLNEEDVLFFIRTVRIADVNADRKPDLVTANTAGSDLGMGVDSTWLMTVFVNGGKGTFRRHFNYGIRSLFHLGFGRGPEAIALGDVNGDGRTDVVEGGQTRSNDVSLFINAPGMCTVPDLFDTRLAVARRRLAERHCAVGKVKRLKEGGSAGYVSDQRPSVGAVLPRGGKVTLILGAAR
jgi:hypothetical protein